MSRQPVAATAAAQARVWLGLAALALSLLLLMLAFGTWRDDLRNWPRPDGTYTTERIHHGLRARLEEPTALRGLTCTGSALLLAAVLLLAAEPHPSAPRMKADNPKES